VVAVAFVAHRLADRNRLRTGVVYLVATGLAYGICILVLALGGAQPGDPPVWLRIDEGAYFWWEAAFIAPLIVAAGLLAAAVAYVLARAAGGTGSFDDTVALVGPAIAVSTTATLVPDLVIGTMLNTGAISTDAWMRGITHPGLTLGLVWTYLSVYLIAFLITLPVAVSRVHRLRPVMALAVGWATFLVYQGVLLIFVR
jgi:hypothetical protein